MNSTEILKNTFYNPTDKNLTESIDYLTTLSKTVFKESHRREFILKTSWKEKEFKKRDLCHVQSATKYFSDNKDFLKQEQIKIVIADLSYFLKRLKAHQNFDFLLGNTNIVPIVINLKIARSIFTNHQIPGEHKDSYSSGTLSIYALRLSLEQRIRGLLGIIYAENKGRPIGLASLIKIAKDLKSVEYHQSINWTQIELVNKWINHFMHRALRPEPWTIYESFEILQPLIDPTFSLIKEGREYHSWHNAAFVLDADEYKNEVKTEIRRKYGEVKIHWASELAVTIENKKHLPIINKRKADSHDLE